MYVNKKYNVPFVHAHGMVKEEGWGGGGVQESTFGSKNVGERGKKNTWGVDESGLETLIYPDAFSPLT